MTSDYAAVEIPSFKQKWLSRAAGALVMVLILTGCFSLVGLQVYIQLQTALHELTIRSQAIQGEISSTLENLNDIMPTEEMPCSVPALRRLRDTVFQGVYIRDTVALVGSEVRCSGLKGLFDKPFDLRIPDISALGDQNYRVWFGKDLTSFGFPNRRGVVVSSGRFATVVRFIPSEVSSPDIVTSAGIRIPQTGNIYIESGVREAFPRFVEPGTIYEVDSERTRMVSCIERSYSCFSLAIPHWRLFLQTWYLMVVSLALAAISGLYVANLVSNRYARYMAFDSRFMRNFDRLFCVYQPIIRLSDMRVSGVEVLCRWRDVDGKMVAPDNFLPMLRNSGGLKKLTRDIVQKAVQELKKLPPQQAPFKVAFNVTPSEFSFGFIQPLFQSLGDLPPWFSLGVEITEEGSSNLILVEAEIRKLKEAGIWTSLDDFGIGFSNIEQVMSLSADKVKIDRFFAMAPPGSLPEKALPTVIDIINHAGKEIVVEGVETAERLEQLKALGVHYAQGYYFSPPLPLEKLKDFLDQFGKHDPMEAVAA